MRVFESVRDFIEDSPVRTTVIVAGAAVVALHLTVGIPGITGKRFSSWPFLTTTEKIFPNRGDKIPLTPGTYFCGSGPFLSQVKITETPLGSGVSYTFEPSDPTCRTFASVRYVHVGGGKYVELIDNHPKTGTTMIGFVQMVNSDSFLVTTAHSKALEAQLKKHLNITSDPEGFRQLLLKGEPQAIEEALRQLAQSNPGERLRKHSACFRRQDD